MTSLVRWARRSGQFGSSPWPAITLDQLPYWLGQFGYQGLGYGPTVIQTMQQDRETIAADFVGYINGSYKTNGPIFALMVCRMFLFSEARFQFQRMNNGRPGKLFGTQDLSILEKPWPNGTTGDLMTRALNDVDLAGNFYATRSRLQNGGGVKIGRLRPDWVTIIKGSLNDPDLTAEDPTAELLGYIFQPGGPGSGLKPKAYLPHEVMHFAPIPDPMATYRGMSWVQPVLTEILGDRAMTTHKVMYFENGATPNLVVSMDTGKMDRKTFQEWIETFENEHSGSMNAFKTLYLGNGAAATVVGSSLKDLDYRGVQGGVESRLASAAGVPPMLVGFEVGNEASTLANFQQAKRLMAEKTLRPLWRNFASSVETLVPPPPGARLWYDDRDIPFLHEDESDAADVLLTKSTAMRLLVDAGYDPDSVVKAIEGNDLALLQHSGLFSVQLHPPGSQDTTGLVPSANGGGNGNGGGQPAQNSEGGTSGQLSGAQDKRSLLANVTNVEQLARVLLASRTSS